jgi:DNA-binding NtrC family response regulator
MFYKMTDKIDKKVLVVDDEIIITMSLDTILQLKWYNVEIANTLNDANECLDKNPSPDAFYALVADTEIWKDPLWIPLAEKFHQLYPQALIIATSANSKADILWVNKCNYFFNKPCSEYTISSVLSGRYKDLYKEIMNNE